MQMIYPVTKESCMSHIGKRVCAVLHDGTQWVGVLSGVTDRGLQFNGDMSHAAVTSKKQSQTNKQTQPKGKLKKAKTQALGYNAAENGGNYNYGGYGDNAGTAFWLDWAAIALLFLLPFFWI
ncbi:hypothetical protein DCC85_09915 [Paenibacillus sp. CAA11]|uniref:hypothetical protein n=1 Tax=Paenibacillus sp. CAA11 TaxID=1532905 RepID=UPI000D393CAE|nr:hypothetical protein [Paenibacillus sp. CAA11]AWB44510.1 hypothetical protein DCC85_09915 [Paenibacillus sp. CAA11]